MVAGSLSPFSLNAHSVSPGAREIGHGNVADTSAPFQYRKILRSWLLFESVDLHAIGYSSPTRWANVLQTHRDFKFMGRRSRPEQLTHFNSQAIVASAWRPDGDRLVLRDARERRCTLQQAKVTLIRLSSPQAVNC
jgi:hypothetical protein